MATHARQPFAALDGTRLNNLTSIKNRQNALSSALASPSKLSLASPTKRRYTPPSFADEFDSENVDPSIFNSPTKRAKNVDGTPQKPSKFVLTDATFSASKTTVSAFPSLQPVAGKRKACSLSASLPTTANATPISQSRGSPKHKRVGLLSKRRASSSPFHRVDPPTFMRAPAAGSGLPFSIDAALSGTIPSYAPKQAASNADFLLGDVKPVRMLEEAMPKSWFFDIHEDTPEEEAANLMEHSALCLDISSDDDEETKRLNLEKEKGKENVPPPDFLANTSSARSSSNALATSIKARRSKRHEELDAMLEDRKALGDLDAAEFYPDGLDASSVEVTAEDALEEASQLKSSPLAHEAMVDVEAESVVHSPSEAPVQPAPVVESDPAEVKFWVDEAAAEESVAVA